MANSANIVISPDLIIKNTFYMLHGWREFTKKQYENLQKELAMHAKQQVPSKSLLPIATRYLINHKVELPPYYAFAEIISGLYNQIEDQLVAIVNKALTKNHRLGAQPHYHFSLQFEWFLSIFLYGLSCMTGSNLT